VLLYNLFFALPDVRTGIETGILIRGFNIKKGNPDGKIAHFIVVYITDRYASLSATHIFKCRYLQIQGIFKQVYFGEALAACRIYDVGMQRSNLSALMKKHGIGAGVFRNPSDPSAQPSNG